MSEFGETVVEGVKFTAAFAGCAAVVGFFGASLQNESEPIEATAGHVVFERVHETTLSDRFGAAAGLGALMFAGTPTMIGAVHVRRQRAAARVQPRHRQ